jgi:acetolactate decarboxylase
LTPPASSSPGRPIACSLPEGVWQALEARCARTGESREAAIVACLADALDLEQHSIFQVSTSGALVKGVYAGATTIADVKRHGDMGLGTFVDLDGEGIMFEGRCYRAGSDGRVAEVDDAVEAPFWVTARFRADVTRTFDRIANLADLSAGLAAMRPSDNLLAAIVVRGRFDSVRLRVACKAASGASLVEATSHQAEFAYEAIDGVLVGFWTPEYARTINVPGLHLHFLSDDRTRGGHLLDVAASGLAAQLHTTTELHVVLPENAAFLAADLSGDPAADLAKAEGAGPRP